MGYMANMPGVISKCQGPIGGQLARQVFVFCCYATNYHKCSDLNYIHFLSHGLKVCAQCRFSAQDLTRLKMGIG